MSNLVSIEGEPEEVQARALALAARMESHDARVRSLVADIKTKEAGHHEGDDDIGLGFLNNGEGGGYQAPTDDGVPFNEYVHEASTGIGPQVVETTSGIAEAMANFTFADAQAKDRIANAAFPVSRSAKLVDG
jgi:hypothetical protein